MIGADSVSHICTSFAINLFPPNYGKQFVDVGAYYINPVPKKKKQVFFIAFCMPFAQQLLKKWLFRNYPNHNYLK